MSFTEGGSREYPDHAPRKLDFLLAGAGHIIIILLGMAAFSGSAQAPSGALEGAVMVRMVSLGTTEPSENLEPPDSGEVQRDPVREDPVREDPVREDPVQEDPVQEDPVREDPVREDPVQEDPVQEAPVQEEQPPDPPAEDQTPVADTGYAAVGSQGDPGAGAPGPGTYESRVYNAVRREYRTSVTPQRSYRIVLTVQPDGTNDVEVVRKSGTTAFDRAVENALARAQIPPMPPGRTAPAVIRIEFLGPED